MTVDNCVASFLQAPHKLDVITKEKRNTDSVILFNPDFYFIRKLCIYNIIIVQQLTTFNYLKWDLLIDSNKDEISNWVRYFLGTSYAYLKTLITLLKDVHKNIRMSNELN